MGKEMKGYMVSIAYYYKTDNTVERTNIYVEVPSDLDVELRYKEATDRAVKFAHEKFGWDTKQVIAFEVIPVWNAEKN